MKKSMLAGGWLGFALGVLCGMLTEGSSWPGILWRASVAALMGGLLLRWLAGVLGRCAAAAEREQLTSASNHGSAATLPAHPRAKV